MFAWVRLANDLWWPGCVLEAETDAAFTHLPALKIMQLCGRGIIPIDTSREESVTLWTGSNSEDVTIFLGLHENQDISEELCVDFQHAMKEVASKMSAIAATVVAADGASQQVVKTTKRETAIPWDNYFMAVAFLSAMRSKDPSTQVGACIVDSRKRIVGIGYNGFPTGCSDDVLPWARVAEDELDTKYPYVVHAEVNAILNKISAELIGCSIYVGLFPCNECAKTIIQSGIKEVVYLSDKYAHTNSMKASRAMFGMAGVRLRQYSPLSTNVVVNFSSIKK